MKPEDHEDRMYFIAWQLRTIPKFRWVKRRKLRKDILRRWHTFVQEVCNEHEDTSGGAG